MKLLPSLACSALLAVALASPAFAQDQTPPAQTPLPPSVSAGARALMTPEMAAARHAMRSACVADIASLCADAKPAQDGAAQPGQRRGGARLQCLGDHAAQLSAPCREALLAMRAARKAAR